MNSKLLIAGLVAACSLLAQPPGPRGRGPMGFGGPGGPGRGGPGLAATVTGAPYSGVEVRTSQQVLAAGGVIARTEQTNVYRDSQGRVRRESTRTGPDGQTHTRITIADPVAGTVTELDAKNKTAFTRTARFPSQSQTAGASRPQMMGAGRRGVAQTDANVKRETLAARTMNGIIASGTRVTHTIPAGTIGNSQALDTVRETWIGGRSQGTGDDQGDRSALRDDDDGVDEYQPQPAGSVALPGSLRLHGEERTGRPGLRSSSKSIDSIHASFQFPAPELGPLPSRWPDFFVRRGVIPLLICDGRHSTQLTLGRFRGQECGSFVILCATREGS